MSIFQRVPAYVKEIDNVPFGKEAATFYGLVLVQEDARFKDCLILHEKVHVVQQWAVGILGVGVAILASLPWWAGVILFFTFLGLWAIPPARKILERQADRVQRPCIERKRESPSPDDPEPHPEGSPDLNVGSSPADIRAFLAAGGTLRQANEAIQGGHDLDDVWQFRLANLFVAALMGQTEVSRPGRGLESGGEPAGDRARLPTDSAEEDLLLALLIQVFERPDLITRGLINWKSHIPLIDHVALERSLETLRSYPIPDVGGEPRRLSYLVEDNAGRIALVDET